MDSGVPGQFGLIPPVFGLAVSMFEEVGVDLVAHAGVGRMLRLTSLAPDIIEAILRGDEPDGLSRARPRGLSLEKLRKNLPVRWEEQRKLWLQS